VWCEELPDRAWALDIPGTPAWVRSPGPRKGWYLKNFYDEQPALNFGWVARPDNEPWRDAIDAPGPRRNRQAGTRRPRPHTGSGAAQPRLVLRRRAPRCQLRPRWIHRLLAADRRARTSHTPL